MGLQRLMHTHVSSRVTLSNKRSVENLDGIEAFPGAAAAVIPVYNVRVETITIQPQRK